MNKYDYLIVGSGLFGAVFAREATDAGKRCLVVEKRGEAGGNVRCEEIEGITVHRFGAHIFHTSDRVVWDYVNRFIEFNRYTHAPIANFRGEIYNLPFNMNTFSRIWNIATPREAWEKIDGQRRDMRESVENLEQRAISLVGRDIYEKLIKGYTEKQWGRDCKDLPASIINRLPVRLTYDNNYFNDLYQGIPIGGYNLLIERLLQGVEVRLNTDFNEEKATLAGLADMIVYTGMLDAFYDYRFGPLAYRSLRFDFEILDEPNYQGASVVNYTDRETPFTRIIEHKHFGFGEQEKTVITREYPETYKKGLEPYYPINDAKNQALFERYNEIACREENVLFGGRLAEYKYYDMDKTIASALSLALSALEA